MLVLCTRTLYFFCLKDFFVVSRRSFSPDQYIKYVYVFLTFIHSHNSQDWNLVGPGIVKFLIIFKILDNILQQNS